MQTVNIRDPIYGFISLNKIEQKIIETYPLQRLRFIHQLGPTLFVYPSANHKRFEHSHLHKHSLYKEQAIKLLKREFIKNG